MPLCAAVTILPPPCSVVHPQLPVNLNFLHRCTACYHLNCLTNIIVQQQQQMLSRLGREVSRSECQSCSGGFHIRHGVAPPRSHNIDFVSPRQHQNLNALLCSPPAFHLLAFAKAKRPHLKGMGAPLGSLLSLTLPTTRSPLHTYAGLVQPRKMALLH